MYLSDWHDQRHVRYHQLPRCLALPLPFSLGTHRLRFPLHLLKAPRPSCGQKHRRGRRLRCRQREGCDKRIQRYLDHHRDSYTPIWVDVLACWIPPASTDVPDALGAGQLHSPDASFRILFQSAGMKVSPSKKRVPLVTTFAPELENPDQKSTEID
jgi:hypothetical protein